MSASPPDEPILTADAVAAFVAHLREQAVPLNTIKAYAHDLRLFLHEAPDDLSQVTPAHIATFLARFPTAATRRRRTSTLQAWYRWLLQHAVVTTSPLGKGVVIPQERHPASPLTPATVAAILAAIPPTQLRDRTLFTLLYETGISVSEALGLLVTEVDLTRGTERLHVVGRGRRERWVFLANAPASVTLLRHYLHQDRRTSGSLFRGDPRFGGSTLPLEYSVVHYAWQKYCQHVGVQATLRQLSHSRRASAPPSMKGPLT